MTHHIVVCTTFRSFDGSPNDRIQREFLRSLAAQDHSGWELVVTRFGETGVDEALRDAGVPFVLVDAERGDYKFSLTDVVLNGLARTDQRGDGSTVILWTTCDVIFPPNLFGDVVRRLRPGDAGTSHPHSIARSLEEYAAGSISLAYPHGRWSDESVDEGIDFVYFDADLLASGTQARSALEEYRFVDWGLFEHFLTGIAELYAARRLNLWAVAPVVKIANDRVASAETEAYFDRSWNRNYEPMRRFLDEHALADDLLRLHDCHSRYELVAPTRYLRRAMGRHIGQLVRQVRAPSGGP